MKLIIGLGNPGKRYINSRHNVGFLVVEELGRQLLPVDETVWKEDKRAECLLLEIPDKDLLLVKPQTMMNASGIAIKKLIQSNNETMKQLDNLYIVHDDLDLFLGEIKIVKKRGSAGHKGVESVIQELGTGDFWRVRCGIGRPGKKGEWLVSAGSKVSENVKQREVTRFVLGGFDRKEKTEVKKMVEKAVEILLYILEHGPEAAANCYHQ